MLRLIHTIMSYNTIGWGKKIIKNLLHFVNWISSKKKSLILFKCIGITSTLRGVFFFSIEFLRALCYTFQWIFR